MRKLLFRLLTGLAFALPLALLTFALVQANAPARPAAQTGECKVCHSKYYEAWEVGSHGQAASNPAFKEAWQSQGSPEKCLACHTTGYDANTGAYKAEGVTCEACHGPAPENHPEEPMPADRAASSCGTCHTETFFEWQVSQHRANDLTCVGCHDPHATKLKAEDASALCATCHRSRASNFSHTEHSKQGLSCANCHLGPLDPNSGDGHATRDHSFNVRLSTCNTCHAYQMHDPAAVHQDQPTPQPPDAMVSVQTMGVSLEPEPVSPLGFAALSGIIGFGAGVVLTPWLERWYRRNARREE
jgi:predicted CXXCH cytochrome family protein